MKMLPEFSSLHKSGKIDVRVIHLVRDGRDMASSENQHEADQFKSVLLQPKAAASRRMLQSGQQQASVKAMQVWSKLNVDVNDCAQNLEVRCIMLQDTLGELPCAST